MESKQSFLRRADVFGVMFVVTIYGMIYAVYEWLTGAIPTTRGLQFTADIFQPLPLISRWIDVIGVVIPLCLIARHVEWLWKKSESSENDLTAICCGLVGLAVGALAYLLDYFSALGHNFTIGKDILTITEVSMVVVTVVAAIYGIWAFFAEMLRCYGCFYFGLIDGGYALIIGLFSGLIGTAMALGMCFGTYCAVGLALMYGLGVWLCWLGAGIWNACALLYLSRPRKQS